MSGVDWTDLDLTALGQQLRRGRKEIEAERMIVAFEHCVELAKVDEAFLDDVLVAVVCLLAHSHESTPRDVLEECFKRAMPDTRWQVDIAPLLAGQRSFLARPRTQDARHVSSLHSNGAPLRCARCSPFERPLSP